MVKNASFVTTALCAFASPLIAQPVVIEVEYEATVKTVTGSFLGYTIPMDTPVTGRFLFDLSVTDSNANINRGYYQHAGTGGFTAAFEALDNGNPVAVTIEGSGSPEVRVEWFPSSNDTWRYDDGLPDHGTMVVNSVPNPDVDLGFSMTRAVLFGSDANTNPWPLVTFPGTSHTFSLSDPSGTILLGITRAATVPAPTSMAGVMLVSGMLGLRRRRRRHRTERSAAWSATG